MIAALLTLTACGTEPLQPTEPGELRTVQMQVLERDGLALAFVPVSISGRGPYLFALDTGASTSTVDLEVAREIGLPETGEQRDVTGIIGRESVPIARVEQWSLGNVALPTSEVALIELPSSDRGHGLRGLLGSDVLITFGRIVVDYDREQLGLPRT